MSVDPCNASNERLVNSEIHNPLSNAENFKFKKYNEPLSKLASLQHGKYNLTLELEKHLKFFLLKICYAGKITHLLRSLPPSLTYNFCRQFNKIRTQFLAYLMSVDPSILKNHIFSDVQLGGVGFNSSKYLTKAAFIGGGKILYLNSLEDILLPKIFLKIQIAYSWIT
ncbi:hypothetical protein P9112_001184 [Eukaryota sp. TZLM1-RC]